MKCCHEGCDAEGIQCVIRDAITGPDGEPKDLIEHYCPEHCHENGYCWMCGDFWGGVEAFEFARDRLCPNCREELDGEKEEQNDE